MIIDYVNNGSVVVPQRSNPDGDLGYDIVATSDPKIVGEIRFTREGVNYYKSIQYIEYETDLYMAPQKEYSARGTEKKYHILVAPRSSISKTNLLLANSVAIVDNGFRGHLKLRMKYVVQPEDLIVLGSENHCGLANKVNQDKIYKKGDRIGQLVVYKNIDAFFNPVGKLSESSRGVGGFGSSGV
jgi:dUTP pyrophosphatase